MCVCVHARMRERSYTLSSVHVDISASFYRVRWSQGQTTRLAQDT